MFSNLSGKVFKEAHLSEKINGWWWMICGSSSMTQKQNRMLIWSY